MREILFEKISLIASVLNLQGNKQKMKRVHTFTKYWFLSLYFLLLLSTSADADQNHARLAELFRSLKSTENVSKASVFESKIWHIWMKHHDPEVESAMFQGLEAMKLQLFEQAFGHFSLLIKLAPDYAEGWNKRATVLYLMGRFKESEADVLRTLELEPRHFGALSGQGLIRIALHDWTGAIYFLESALKINPHMHGVIMNLKYARQKQKESMT